MDYGAGGAEPDPDLAVLDEEPKHPRQRSGRKGRSRISQATVEQFDLATLDLSHSGVDQPDVAKNTLGPTARRRSIGKGRVVRSRRKKTRQRKVTEAIAATVLVMLVVAVLGMAGSCVVDA